MTKNEDGSVTLTREELHAQVWARPLRDIAEEYGVSDVGLAKICTRLRVPRPPQGHWARAQSGRTVAPTPLPSVEGVAGEVTIGGQKVADGPAVPVESSAVQAERLSGSPIVVPERLSKPHPYVVTTQAALRECKYERDGLVSARGEGVLRVAVSRSSIGRAMRIMHALISALEQRGHSVVVDVPRYGKNTMYAVVDGERIEFHLRERLMQERRVITPAEEKKFRESPWLAPSPYDTKPSGRLYLEILTYARDVKRCWEDRNRLKLEDCLNDVIVSLLKLADKAKTDRQQREEELRRREAQERERAEKLARIKEEEKRVEHLFAEADAWYRSQRLRDYVHAVRKAAQDGLVCADEALERWVIWALQQADRLDPLAKSPPSVLDERRTL